MELLHECKGELRPLQLLPRRLPRRMHLAEYGKDDNPLTIRPVPYYESYECRDCMTRILIAK